MKNRVIQNNLKMLTFFGALFFAGLLVLGFSSFADTKKTAKVVTNSNTKVAVVREVYQPENLSVKYFGDLNEVRLQWFQGKNVRGVIYSIERTEKSSNTWVVIDKTDALFYRDSKIKPETTYLYRVRATHKNKKSSYSDLAEIRVEKFVPNLIVGTGGNVLSEDGRMVLVFPPNSTDKDLSVLITRKTNVSITLADENLEVQPVAYEILAKNSSGDIVTDFSTQITLKLLSSGLSTSKAKRPQLGMIKNEKPVLLKTFIDESDRGLYVLSTKLAPVFIATPKTTDLEIFLKILGTLFLVGAIGSGGYFGYRYLKIRQYQKDHAQDFIYRH